MKRMPIVLTVTPPVTEAEAPPINIKTMTIINVSGNNWPISTAEKPAVRHTVRLTAVVARSPRFSDSMALPNVGARRNKSAKPMTVTAGSVAKTIRDSNPSRRHLWCRNMSSRTVNPRAPMIDSRLTIPNVPGSSTSLAKLFEPGSMSKPALVKPEIA